MATEETYEETEHRTVGHGYPQEINTNNKHLGCLLQNDLYPSRPFCTLQHLTHKDLKVLIKGGGDVFHVNEVKISP